MILNMQQIDFKAWQLKLVKTLNSLVMHIRGKNNEQKL